MLTEENTTLRERMEGKEGRKKQKEEEEVRERTRDRERTRKRLKTALIPYQYSIRVGHRHTLHQHKAFTHHITTTTILKAEIRIPTTT
jgi:hypothetical protein